jgi:protein required for attachment to host cells
MPTTPKPAWILIANTTRARVLRQDAGNAIVVLESFVHPAGRGQRTDPPVDARQKECTRFANELGAFLEYEARLAHFGALTIFASASFLQELMSALGKTTRSLLSASHELDLTSVGIAELERRVFKELALAAQ